MEFLTNKIGYSTRVSYFICTITYQQHYLCGASAQHVRSINTICANLQHVHKERIVRGVIAKEYIGKHKHRSYIGRTCQTIISFNKKDVSNIFIELQYI